jgi:hypothetical protein
MKKERRRDEGVYRRSEEKKEASRAEMGNRERKGEWK